MNLNRLIVVWVFILLAFAILIGGQGLWSLMTISDIELAHQQGQTFMWDFGNTWSGGWLLRHDMIMDIFDHQKYSDDLRQIFKLPSLADHEWSYPPVLLFLSYLLSWFSPLTSYTIWTFGTIILLGMVLYYGMKSFVVIKPVMFVLMLPVIMNNMTFGQNGALSGALLLAILFQFQRRPIFAGVLTGLMLFKPQFGILLPFVFIATRQWKAFLSAMLSSIVLVLMTGLVFGFDKWQGFFLYTQPMMTNILSSQAGYQANAITVFGLVRTLEGGLLFSTIIQTITTLSCVVLIYVLWRKSSLELLEKVTLTMGMTLLSSPYGYTYDMVGFLVMISIMMIHRKNKLSSLNWQDLVIIILITLPSWQRIERANYPYPISCLLIGYGCWWVYRLSHLHHSRR